VSDWLSFMHCILDGMGLILNLKSVFTVLSYSPSRQVIEIVQGFFGGYAKVQSFHYE
jgi:hypothetical protein